MCLTPPASRSSPASLRSPSDLTKALPGTSTSALAKGQRRSYRVSTERSGSPDINKSRSVRLRPSFRAAPDSCEMAADNGGRTGQDVASLQPRARRRARGRQRGGNPPGTRPEPSQPGFGSERSASPAPPRWAAPAVPRAPARPRHGRQRSPHPRAGRGEQPALQRPPAASPTSPQLHGGAAHGRRHHGGRRAAAPARFRSGCRRGGAPGPSSTRPHCLTRGRGLPAGRRASPPPAGGPRGSPALPVGRRGKGGPQVRPPPEATRGF